MQYIVNMDVENLVKDIFFESFPNLSESDFSWDKEQKDYPREDGNGFYDKRYDTENQKVYNTFLEAMAELNQKAKDLNMNGEPKFSSDNG